MIIHFPYKIWFSRRVFWSTWELDVIDAGVKFISDFGIDDLMAHFMYCGLHFHNKERGDKLKEIILTKLRKYGIQSSILTMLQMVRYNFYICEANNLRQARLYIEVDCRSQSSIYYLASMIKGYLLTVHQRLCIEND